MPRRQTLPAAAIVLIGAGYRRARRLSVGFHPMKAEPAHQTPRTRT